MSSINVPDYSQDTGIYPYNGKVLLAAVVLLSVVILFVILLHIYARWFLRRRPVIAHVVSEPLHTLASTLAARNWYVDDVTVFSKGLDRGRGELVECVVCLGVMEEGEEGRVLPRCKHVFHVECVDVWLRSRSTCPICRALVMEKEEAVAVDVVEEEAVVGNEESGGINEVTEGNVSWESSTSASSSSASSSCSSSISSSSSSSSSSFSCSLKRMVSKSRSESRVFPSAGIV
ncbi:RING-H2 finger protein ATL5-like [Asparagus officinalis]|uniref:RING-H2 finger protein ATL5-like n=1 Tax=Asparagus officinalis TaxID=4686 RepID=UPI00098DF9B4|nr:RING-H2 finger protein ATL5-like [Asparagus officinalis]